MEGPGVMPPHHPSCIDLPLLNNNCSSMSIASSTSGALTTPTPSESSTESPLPSTTRDTASTYSSISSSLSAVESTGGMNSSAITSTNPNTSASYPNNNPSGPGRITSDGANTATGMPSIGSSSTPQSSDTREGSSTSVSNSTPSAIMTSFPSSTSGAIPSSLNIPVPSSTLSRSSLTTPLPTILSQSATESSGHKPATGAIAGGIVGALLFLLLGTLLLRYRRPLLKRLAHVHLPTRKNSHTAPSAEFMNHPAVLQRRSSSALLRTASPFSYVNGAGAGAPAPLPLGAYPYADSAEGNPFDEPPPPFTAGGFSDPVIEKASASAAAHRHMFEDRAGSSDAGAPLDHDEAAEVPYDDGMSGIGHAV